MKWKVVSEFVENAYEIYNNFLIILFNKHSQSTIAYKCKKPGNIIYTNLKKEKIITVFSMLIWCLKGGDVMHENITANVSEDTITLEFVRLDGVLVTQLIDFANVSIIFSITLIIRYNKIIWLEARCFSFEWKLVKTLGPWGRV